MVRLLKSFVKALTGNGFLLRQLVVRSFSARHAELFLGWVWPLISTGVQFLLYWIVFSRVIGIRLANERGVGFGFFLMAGLVPVLAFNDALLRAASLFRSNRNLIQRVSFPVEVLLVADLAATLGYHGLAFATMAVICAAAGFVSIAALGWVALGLVVLLVWLLGLALILSVLGAFVPDVKEVLNLGLLLLFYGAPIVYPLSMIHSGWLRALIGVNPVTVFAQLVRAGLLGLEAPGWPVVAGVLAAGLLLVVVGGAGLEKVRPRLADVV